MRSLVYLSAVALIVSGCESDPGGGGGQGGGGSSAADAGFGANLMPGAPCAVDPTPEDLDGDMIEDVIEPYLMQQGLVQRTPRGRMLSAAGWRYLDRKPPKSIAAQLDLLGEDEGEDG